MAATARAGGAEGKTARSTRERILDAASEVIRTSGLAQATTKEIARAAGCSEANLYKHFNGKEELFVQVLRERLPGLIHLLVDLPDRAGKGRIEANLEELALQAVSFYEAGMAMSSSLFSEPKLLEGLREWLRSRGVGPQRAVEQLAAYLRAEQKLGRISRSASPDAGAALLLGACYQRAFLSAFIGADVLDQPLQRFAKDISRTVVRGLR